MIPASSFLTFLTLFLFSLSVAAITPKKATWSPEAFGPDGPWNAVEVSIGGQPSISLFPGRMFHTYVTTSDYCAFNNTIAHCMSGTYLEPKAGTGSGTGSSTQRISYAPPTQHLYAGVEASGTASLHLNSIDLGIQSVVKDHPVAYIESESQMRVSPGGTRYPIFTGCLSFGSPEPQQVFTVGGDKPNINGSMVPWALKDAGSIPSSSFGLHYGSAAPSGKMPGSLLFGGYDRNRVVGSVLSLNGELGDGVTLQDVSIHVINGSSPFPPIATDKSTPNNDDNNNSNSTTIANLLRHSNSSIPLAGLPIILDPCSPYLTLPKSTCDAIAARLPVVYNTSLGLYFWNTTSPRYNLITASASTLAFTFMGGANTQSLTIHVPFGHLNLTLSPPYTQQSVPYFPCFTGGPGAYVLGRAFFQDAFLGANWERAKIWLAQAPGPNIPTGADVATVAPEDEGIAGGQNVWERSWDGVWRGLTPEEVEGLDGGDGAVVVTGKGDGGSGGGGSGGGGEGGGGSGEGDGGERAGGAEGGQTAGLSTAAMAGIGAGAAIAGMLLVGAVGLFFWRRRMAKLAATPQAGTGPSAGLVYADYYEKSAVPVPAEVPQNGVYEMPGDHGHDSWGWQSQSPR
ncbi:hypothetical protein C8A00DRAFT_33183 [Chaetomidium leptoderma]|uniref:Peptidase A1 domain-containing protein n=1 Tax=Chaetomidium leptoderma TaxID=669021 RepID=A0AAN6VPJ8_9PEZI|nr:hypothetical protein C8A00DRAFT_33183 [Chaetomidium leptoderma]